MQLHLFITCVALNFDLLSNSTKMIDLYVTLIEFQTCGTWVHLNFSSRIAGELIIELDALTDLGHGLL